MVPLPTEDFEDL